LAVGGHVDGDGLEGVAMSVTDFEEGSRQSGRRHRGGEIAVAFYTIEVTDLSVGTGGDAVRGDPLGADPAAVDEVDGAIFFRHP
jgi:hypothetical protein